MTGISRRVLLISAGVFFVGLEFAYSQQPSQPSPPRQLTKPGSQAGNNVYAPGATDPGRFVTVPYSTGSVGGCTAELEKQKELNALLKKKIELLEKQAEELKAAASVASAGGAKK